MRVPGFQKTLSNSWIFFFIFFFSLHLVAFLEFISPARKAGKTQVLMADPFYFFSDVNWKWCLEIIFPYMVFLKIHFKFHKLHLRNISLVSKSRATISLWACMLERHTPFTHTTEHLHGCLHPCRYLSLYSNCQTGWHTHLLRIH